MKTIVLFLLIVSGGYASAQQIEPLYDNPSYAKRNVYYKDLYNDLDTFVGTWMYTNGNTSLTITLQKKIRASRRNFFEDMLIGGYKYVVNGTTVVNTLPLLNNNYTNPIYYSLHGSCILGQNSLGCIGCGPETRRLYLSFDEPNRDILMMGPRMIFERVDEGGVQKVKVVFKTTMTGSREDPNHEPEFSDYSVPFGTYVLTRQ